MTKVWHFSHPPILQCFRDYIALVEFGTDVVNRTFSQKDIDYDCQNLVSESMGMSTLASEEI